MKPEISKGSKSYSSTQFTLSHHLLAQYDKKGWQFATGADWTIGFGLNLLLLELNATSILVGTYYARRAFGHTWSKMVCFKWFDHMVAGSTSRIQSLSITIVTHGYQVA